MAVLNYRDPATGNWVALGTTTGGGTTTSPYKWSTSTTAADPGSGYVRANNATPSSATAVYASVYDTNGTLVRLDTLSTGSTFWFYRNGDITQNIKYTVSATPTNNANLWFTIPVTFVSTGTGGFSPSNNNLIDASLLGGGSGGGASLTALNQGLLATKVWSTGSSAYVWPGGGGTAPDSNAFTNIIFIDPTGAHDPKTSTGGRNTANDLWETGTPAGGGGSGTASLLAYTRYNPGTQAAVNATTTSYVDIDATNLTVTFTAPSSGRVIVVLSAQVNQLTNGSGYYWGLRSGGSLVANSNCLILYHQNSETHYRPSMRVVIDGLTPSTSYTYTWAHMRGFGTATCQTIYGGGADPAVMEVWSGDTTGGGGGGGATTGGILAAVNYNPGSPTGPTSTSTTATDVDATNLVVTFTAPASGNVLVQLSSNAITQNSPSAGLGWCLRSGSSDVAGTKHQAIYNQANSIATRITLPIAVTGLTPSTSYTYKWGQYISQGSGTVQTQYGGVIGVASMIVFAA